MKRTLAWVALVGAVTVGPAALAGTKQNRPVTVSIDTVNGGGAAYGSMGSARASADTVEYIGCWVNATQTTISMSCGAEDASGNMLLCLSSSPSMVQAVQAIASDSYLTFSTDLTSECLSLQVKTASFNLPKTP
jgi:hypothetical protein